MGWVVNATSRTLYPQDRHGSHCIGGWVGPDGCRKISPPLGFEQRTVQPIANFSVAQQPKSGVGCFLFRAVDHTQSDKYTHARARTHRRQSATYTTRNKHTIPTSMPSAGLFRLKVYLTLFLPVALFPQCFQTELLHAFLASMHATIPDYLILVPIINLTTRDGHYGLLG